MIAGYYDAKPGEVKRWLESAARVEGVVGILYTTWKNSYGDLETFARAARE